MNQVATSQGCSRAPTAQIEGDEHLPVIRIRRDFSATPAQLFAAHTNPDLFAQWSGPEGATTTITEWDARDGGAWAYTARVWGESHAFRGCFHTVSAERIVQTFTWLGQPDAVALETLKFLDLGDGRTRLEAQSLVDSFEARDAWLASGMEAGVDGGYAKLDGLFAQSHVDTKGSST